LNENVLLDGTDTDLVTVDVLDEVVRVEAALAVEVVLLGLIVSTSVRFLVLVTANTSSVPLTVYLKYAFPYELLASVPIFVHEPVDVFRYR
jgi:hypothetical protein